MAEEGEPETPAYGTAPAGHSLAWMDIKLSEIKDFMQIDKVPPSLPSSYETHVIPHVTVDAHASRLEARE